MKAELTSAFVMEQTLELASAASKTFGGGGGGGGGGGRTSPTNGRASPPSTASSESLPRVPRRSLSHSVGSGSGVEAARPPPVALSRSASARSGKGGKGVSHAALYLLSYERWLKVLSSARTLTRTPALTLTLTLSPDPDPNPNPNPKPDPNPTPNPGPLRGPTRVHGHTARLRAAATRHLYGHRGRGGGLRQAGQLHALARPLPGGPSRARTGP